MQMSLSMLSPKFTKPMVEIKWVIVKEVAFYVPFVCLLWTAQEVRKPVDKHNKVLTLNNTFAENPCKVKPFFHAGGKGVSISYSCSY